MKIGANLTTLALVGGIAVAGYFAYNFNFLGIRNLIDGLFLDAQEVAQGLRKPYPYPFMYPYPPTQSPDYVNPTTMPAAHYKMAGAPNLGVQGAGLLPNSSLWWDKGAMSWNRTALPSAINYGPYKFEAPIFQTQRYGVHGTNLSYPFLKMPFCPPDQFQGQDGRCYTAPIYPHIPSAKF